MIPMSDAQSPSADPVGTRDRPDRHETPPRDLRDGDLVRVTTSDTEVERAAVIARWKFAQQDFSPDTAPEVPTKTRRWTDHTGEESVEKTEVKIRGTADRSTLITEDGRKYAVVDWTATDDAPYLYLMVIDSEDPDERRWTSLGRVQSVERYGPEPEYRMAAYKWRGTREQDADVVRFAASEYGELDAPEDVLNRLPEPSVLRNLAGRRGASERSDLSTRDLQALTDAYRAVRAHVERTGEPVLSDDASEDVDTLDREFHRRYFAAVFPDSEGGEVVAKRPNSGPPSGDIPPWEAEQDADPEFSPLGQTDG